jgi:hypothetical protein
MSVVADSGCTLGIRVETGSGTIVVAIEGPVDISVTRRIQEALRPLAQVKPFTVRVDLSAAQAPPHVAREIRRRFAAA